MLSTKRLLYVISVVLVISTIFMLYNINEERASHISIERSADPVVSAMPDQNWEGTQQLTFVLTGESKREIYGDLYQNVRRLLDDLKLPVEATDFVDFSSLDTNTIVIFCSDAISDYADLYQLGQFVENGGRVIFAAGLPEGNIDSYLNPFLGIMEKTIKENYNTLAFVGDLFPVQPEEMTYNGYNASTWVRVRPDAKVYVQDAEKEVPVLYTYPYGQGTSCVINGTFLADRNCCGLLTGAIGTVADSFLYPVVGLKTIFLDNFPMVTYVNDKLCMKLYGCSTEAFVRDVVWPQFQGIALRGEVAYTSAILAESSDAGMFTGVNDSLFTIIGKSALQYGGELVYAADCRDDALVFNEELLNSFSSVFDRYQVNGLALMGQTEFDPAMLTPPGVTLSAVRSRLSDEEAFRVQDDYFAFPCASQGNNMEEGNLFEITSVLSAYGMVSHAFDVNLLIAQDETASWDLDKEQIAYFEDQILDETHFLTSKTLSNTENYVNSYQSLEYEWQQDGNQIRLNCRGAIPDQAFFLKTGREIQSAEGLSYEEVGHGYYCLKLQSSSAVIELG